MTSQKGYWSKFWKGMDSDRLLGNPLCLSIASSAAVSLCHFNLYILYGFPLKSLGANFPNPSLQGDRNVATTFLSDF